MNYSNVESKGGVNAAGVSTRIHFAPIRDFDVIAKPETPEDNEIGDNHEFKTGKGFITVGVYQHISQLMGETIGDPSSPLDDFKVPFFVKGLEKNNALTLSLMKFDDWMVLIEDIQTGDVYQLGTDINPAAVKVTPVTGTTGGEGRKGFEGEIHAIQPMLFYYTGDIVLKPVTLGGN